MASGEGMMEAIASVPTSVTVTFPIYRYHAVEDMGSGSFNRLKLLESPLPVRDSWDATRENFFGDRLDYLRHPRKGTDGIGLLKSDIYLIQPQVVPGGILDAAGRDIVILDYDGRDEPRPSWVSFLAGFVEIAGWRYSHRYTFAEPTQLTLDELRRG
ncbi:MAG: hypothetical protein KDK08_16735 [Rhizobiaceae bacterium]|nr:hypothetical protein [Alphaproteobacteria bacterium]MCB1468742.1 hypothetical protein [Rhizobiaceae bacterium]